MITLSQEQKDLVLDFYFRCGGQDRIEAGRDLIASDERAAALYSHLESTLKDLDMKYEPCPDNLAELTISRLKMAAETGQSNLEKLIEAEQGRSEEKAGAAAASGGRSESGNILISAWRNFWHNVPEVAAVAAIILVITSVGFPTLSSMRHNAWRQKCAANLGGLGKALVSYASEHDSRLPEVPLSAGSPWWKVGSQGERAESNTRNMWLLVKQGYADGDVFVCPARKDAESFRSSVSDGFSIDSLQDFPSRRNVTYSFIIMCEKSKSRIRSGIPTVIASDANPVFESVFDGGDCAYDGEQFGKIVVDDKLRNMMSLNHRGHGQNVLLTGGSASFEKQRVILDDDIFTVKDADVYSGVERPCNQNDMFLVP
jgi:hypothetical protein